MTAPPSQHALPRFVGPASKRADVLRAVRDRGGSGSTHADMAHASGHAPHHCALLAWTLVQTGHLVEVGYRLTPDGARTPVYVTARDAHLLGPAARKRRTPGAR